LSFSHHPYSVPPGRQAFRPGPYRHLTQQSRARALDNKFNFFLKNQ
jgi:hypothetical protein